MYGRAAGEWMSTHHFVRRYALYKAPTQAVSRFILSREESQVNVLTANDGPPAESDVAQDRVGVVQKGGGMDVSKVAQYSSKALPTLSRRFWL